MKLSDVWNNCSIDTSEGFIDFGETEMFGDASYCKNYTPTSISWGILLSNDELTITDNTNGTWFTIDINNNVINYSNEE